MLRCSEEDFLKLKEEYNRVNQSFKKTFIFHVGQAAGFYSELGGMLSAMMYCYCNEIKFVLYADDANFSQNGWEDFFVPFCEMNHKRINHYINRRIKKVHFLPRVIDRIGKEVLLSTCHADYITYDLFDQFIYGLGNQNVEWKELNISGLADYEVRRFIPLAMRYNESTESEIEELIRSLNLPKEYVSIHVRGGDKLADQSKSISVDECLKYMEEASFTQKNIFVFTDDYCNVEVIKKRHTEWNIYTLTNEDERGYDNDKFNVLPWEKRRSDLIKLFAIMEICINSSIHFGYEHACSNGIIKLCRENKKYYPMYSKAYLMKENK